MNDLRAALIQTSLSWEDKKTNLAMFAKKIEEIKESVDLIILPEMFNTGFSMNSKDLGEGMDGPTVSWMQRSAAEKKAVITGSFICAEKGNYFNRLIWMRPDGSYETYDKRHLFRMGNEQEHYASGNKRLIVNLNGWKICPLVCYDLRFPAWCRNTKTGGFPSLAEKGSGDEVYELLIFVANWPERRSFPWKTLLQARAIENLSYVIGVNRVGKDGHGVDHSGDSVALNFKGEPIRDIQPHKEQTAMVTLDHKMLLDFRKQFPADLDADEFTIQL